MGHLILVRHSITDASEAGRNLGQRSDPPLDADGLALAERLAPMLVAELADLAGDGAASSEPPRLVSSPALRCRQTAGAIAGGLGLGPDAIGLEAGLLEIDYGDWDGLTADECHARDPQLRAAWKADPFATRCPGGESGADVARRSRAVMAPIEEWLAGEPSRTAVVVAHNHVNRLRLCDLFGWPMRDYRRRLIQSPAGVNIVWFGRGGPVLRCVNVQPA